MKPEAMPPLIHPRLRSLALATFVALVLGKLWPAWPDFWQAPHTIAFDDARHFVTWLRQLADPGLFPDDPIAAYFHSLTPAIYKLLYWPAAPLGIDVVTWEYAFMVPLACLLLVVAAYGFTSTIFADARLAGIAGLILCYYLAGAPTGGIPRSFGFQIVLLALTAFLGDRRWLLLLSIALGAALYPVAGIVCLSAMGIVFLFELAETRQFATASLPRLLTAGAALALGLLLFFSGANDSGPALTLEEARHLPIFGPDGRTKFFEGSFLNQILFGARSGGLPFVHYSHGKPSPLLSVLGTLAMFGLGFLAYGRIANDTPAQRRKDVRRLLLALLIAGLVLVFLVYFVAFRAHTPSKYVRLSIYFVYVLCTLFIVLAIIDVVSRFLDKYLPEKAGRAARAVLIAVVWLLILYQSARGSHIIRDKDPELTRYLETTPRGTVVAGLVSSLDSIPAFSGRSAYAAMELLVPYKRNYYQLIAQRIDTLYGIYHASFGPEFAQLVGQSRIDYFIIADQNPEVSVYWLQSFPKLEGVAHEDVFSRNPAATESCIAQRGARHVLVDAHCMQRLALQP